MTTNKLLTLTLAATSLAVAQVNRSAAPVLRYEPPKNFMRSAIYPPEDYVSNQFNASIQIYPFEPFSGNPADAFQRTLFRDRIDPRYREENVSGTPNFVQGTLPGGQVLY